MLIESVKLKNKLIEKAMDKVVSLNWVLEMIERVEKENSKNNIINKIECPKCSRMVETKPDHYMCLCGARFNVLDDV